MFVHDVWHVAGEDIVFMATDIELLGNVDWVMLQSCFDAHFLLVLEKQDSSHDNVHTFFAIVQLIGTNKQADNFICRCLHLLFIILCERLLIFRFKLIVKIIISAKPILVCLMANAHYKTQTYRPTDNA